MKTWAMFVSILALLSPLASAQQRATTDDGKVVFLFNDGTWKPAPPAATPKAVGSLSIEVGIVYETGPRPVARETFYLIDTNFTSLVKALSQQDLTTFATGLTWLGVGDPSGPNTSDKLKNKIVEMRAGCNRVLEGMKEHVIATRSTDFTGKATFETVPSGNYTLVGFTVKPGKASIVWSVPVEIKAGTQSIILDQKNASAIRGY